MNDDEPGKLLRIEDAATYLNISTRTLRRYISKSGLKFLDLNPGGKRRNIRIDRNELDRFISENMGYMKQPERVKRVYNRSENYRKYARKKTKRKAA